MQGISGFDRRLVCVPKFCPRECPGRAACRYQRYLEEAKNKEIFIQICNHNYLLADAMHRSKDYRPLLADYRALIVDEAHQLPEAAKQMYGKDQITVTADATKGRMKLSVAESSSITKPEEKIRSYRKLGLKRY